MTRLSFFVAFCSTKDVWLLQPVPADICLHYSTAVNKKDTVILVIIQLFWLASAIKVGGEGEERPALSIS